MLSIIIPTYGSSSTLKFCMDSILNQTYPNFEIIFIDGYSTDATIDIIKAYARYDDRIRFISETDEGVYDAMNKGIKLAKGEWLLFLGADDKLYSATILEEIFKRPDIERQDVVYSNVKIVGNTSWAKDGSLYDGEFNLQKLLSKNICHQCIFYKKDFVDCIGYYNTDYKLCADWDYNLRCWAKTKFLYINKVVAYFTAGGESTKTNEDKKFSADFLQNVIHYFKLSPFHPLLNTVSFPYYYEVLAMQKRSNYIKYLANKVKSKLRLIEWNLLLTVP